jgi:hypothetical protein
VAIQGWNEVIDGGIKLFACVFMEKIVSLEETNSMNMHKPN